MDESTIEKIIEAVKIHKQVATCGTALIIKTDVIYTELITCDEFETSDVLNGVEIFLDDSIIKDFIVENWELT